MTSMNTPTQSQSPRIDRSLLARLTGALGDSKTVSRICNDFGNLYAEFLPDVFHSETGIDISVSYLTCEAGLASDLVAGMGDSFCFADASLRNWSPDFTLACGNRFIITLMEYMLGAIPETIEEPPERALSGMELDLANMVFERIASVLRSGVNAPGGFEPVIEAAHNAQDRENRGADNTDQYAAAVRMRIELGKVASQIALVIPQRVLLKTVVVAPRAAAGAARDQGAWAEKLAGQVHRSNVTLEARIGLQQLTLGAVSRLVAGDVIAFRDKGDVRVDVSANGNDLYVCELGRSGDRYTVRVKDNIGSDDEIIKQLIG